MPALLPEFDYSKYSLIIFNDVNYILKKVEGDILV